MHIVVVKAIDSKETVLESVTVKKDTYFIIDNMSRAKEDSKTRLGKNFIW